MRKSTVQSSAVKPLNYRHTVTVVHAGGRATTVVKGTTSLNTWTRKDGGVTVRVDHSQTLRFANARITKRSDA